MKKTVVKFLPLVAVKESKICLHDTNLKLNLTSLKLCNFDNRKTKKREIKKKRKKKERKERQKTRHQKIRGKLVFHKELNFHYWPFVKVISTQKLLF